MDTTTKNIPIDSIDDPTIAMRENVHDDEIENLMSDMKKVGLIEPIVVRPVGARYEIIAGHRRTTAARLLGWAHIEAKITDVNDDTAFTMRAMENLSRHDVDPVSEAVFVGTLMTKQNKSEADIAEIFNRSLQWVKQRLEVFSMPEYLQNYLRQKRISLGSALVLNTITDEQKKKSAVDFAALNGVSVAQANRWALDLNAESGTLNMSTEQVLNQETNTQQTVTKVACKRCGNLGILYEMDLVYVHRGDCPSEDIQEAEQP